MRNKKYPKYDGEDSNGGLKLSFYPKQVRFFDIRYCTSFYFDNRHVINGNVTSYLCMLAVIVLACTGHWGWSLTLLVLQLFLPHWGEFFLHLPIYNPRTPDCEWDDYGISLSAGPNVSRYSIPTELVIKKGSKYKYIYLPWSLEYYRHSLLLKDGITWVNEYRGRPFGPGEDQWERTDLWEEKHTYIYTLRSGEVQKRIARIMVSEREWRRRWLPFTSLFARIRRVIDIEFDKEIGERVGSSWKGGCIGCGYDLKPNETPLECLRRMERERKFT